MTHYQYVVVGRGLIGSAAARHLALEAESVALVGPDEPVTKERHHGVFGSHYDEGRITRVLDQDETWARLAQASIERYRDIEAASGINFYSEVGLLAAAPGEEGAAYVDALGQVALQLNAPADRLDPALLAAEYPAMQFAEGTVGIRQLEDAGHVSPRRLVTAQAAAAQRAGAAIIREEVTGLRETVMGVDIATAGGTEISAEHLLLATGGYTAVGEVPGVELDWTVEGRVVVLFEIDDSRADAIGAMPSMIYHRPWSESVLSTYLLPPIEYPDGKRYLKIGSGTFSHPLTSAEEVGHWFRSPDADEDIETLTAFACELIPALKGAPVTSQTCMTTHTATGLPYVGVVGSRTAIAAGGNGAAAKSSDEIGRLAALTMLDRDWPAGYDEAAFQPVSR